MRAVLEGRENAALVRVEELRAELERVKEALAEAEEVLRHRAIGLEQYLEALAEQEAPAVVEPGGSAAAEESTPDAGREPRRSVARKESGVSVEALGRDYRRIMGAFDSSDARPVRERGSGCGREGWWPGATARGGPRRPGRSR